MTHHNEQNSMLDDMFEIARNDQGATPTPELLGRVLADAEAFHPAPAYLQNSAPKRGSIFRQLSNALGGWPSMTGLAAAAVAGVWIGFVATPEILSTGVAGIMGADSEVYLAYLEGGYSYGLEE